MSKQKIVLIILVIGLVLAGVAGIIYYKNRLNKQIKDNQKNSTAISEAPFLSFKEMICSNGGKSLDVSVLKEKARNFPKESPVFGMFTLEELSFVRGYYFCNGLVSNDLEGACANGLVSADLVEQCKNGFYFDEMILASLSGDKVKSEEICRAHLGDIELCNYIGTLDEIKKNDLCSKSPENVKPSCTAFFNGDDSLCNGSEQEDDCFLAAKVLKTIDEKNMERCDDLLSQNPIDNYDTICKLNLDKKQDVCNDKYKKFIQSFCGSGSSETVVE